MKPRFTVAGLLLLVTVTCVFFGFWRVMSRQRPITVKESAQITPGMSKSQVNWRLGGPHKVYAAKDQTSWVFEYDDREMEPLKFFTVTFRRGAVVEVEKSPKSISEGVRKAILERGPP